MDWMAVMISVSSKAGMDWTADTTSELSTRTLPLEITEMRVSSFVLMVLQVVRSDSRLEPMVLTRLFLMVTTLV
ncbi:MAG TPA: hypothetical protein DER17_04430 [Oscillibacter sp.]|nr:hypothetical protein [Oscillibacter sp.]